MVDVRKYIYEHMQRLSLHFYEDKQIGTLMSNVVNDTDLFEQLIAHAIPDVVVNVITLIGVSSVLLVLNVKLTLLSIIPIPFVILSLRIFARYVRPAFRNRQKELGNLNALLNDNLSGIREIKAFTREPEEAQRVNRGIENYRASQLKALRLMATFQPFVEFTSSLGMLIVIYFGGRLTMQGALPVADLVAFFLYLESFYAPVRSLSGAWEAVQSSLAGADRVAGLLGEPQCRAQAQPAALDRSGQLVAAPEEPFEDPVDVRLADPDPEVPHGDRQRRPVDEGGDLDLAGLARILDGVVYQVSQHLRDTVRVGVQDRKGLRKVDQEAMDLGVTPDVVRYVPYQVWQLDRLGLKAEEAGVDDGRLQ